MFALVEKDAMNTHRFALGYPALPDRRERRVQRLRGLILIDLVDEGDICAVWENEGKLIISRSEDVIDRVIGSVKNLNIPHVFFLSASALGR